MEVEYTQDAKDDIAYWKSSQNSKIMQRITSIVLSIQASPFKGIGRPKPLKHKLTGLWSRRINKEHRIIYEVFDDYVLVHSLRGHY